ncbi:hypothetical protein BaRGS_00028548 [Batillaria attramentaria]|uniref:Uncharacterized protein n=1 Tax=Batillaria attramentaria TaxID=370345 RepID=A0ABD0K024_9CAEN
MASEPSLSQSVDKSIDPKLTEETKHRHLHRTRELLEGAGSDEDIRRAIQDCLACATQQDIIDGILPHCRATQLEFVLRETVTAGLWQVVGSLLLDERLDDAQRSRAAVEVSSRADQDDFVKHVLQFCRTDIITARAVISKLIERHFWRAVAGLADYVQGTAVNWISDEALQHAGDADLAKIFQRLNCSTEQSMFWAMEAVRRRKWQAVTTIVSRFYKRNNVYYECVISEIMTDAKDEDVAELAATLNIAGVAATLNNEYLSNSILSECVRRRLWNSVSALLRAHSHRLSDKATRKWIIEEAIQSAEDYHLRSILPFLRRRPS